MSRAGAIAPESFSGVPIYISYFVKRGRYVMAFDPAKGGECMFEGRGLDRGIGYKAPDVERGYVIETYASGSMVVLVDAVTGKVIRRTADECVEVEERYRYPTIKEVINA